MLVLSLIADKRVSKMKQSLNINRWGEFSSRKNVATFRLLSLFRREEYRNGNTCNFNTLQNYWSMLISCHSFLIVSDISFYHKCFASWVKIKELVFYKRKHPVKRCANALGASNRCNDERRDEREIRGEGGREGKVMSGRGGHTASCGFCSPYSLGTFLHSQCKLQKMGTRA